MNESLAYFRELILSVDPNATQTKETGTGNYTVWTPREMVPLMPEDTGEEIGWKVTVERYTQLEHDPMVKNIASALDDACIPYQYQQNAREETAYIHHIFICLIY